MADITIHGIDEEAMDRLRRDAEASRQTVEEFALHILTNWHGLIANRTELAEGVRRFGDTFQKTQERLAEAKNELEKRPGIQHLRAKYDRQDALPPQHQNADGTDDAKE